MRGAFESHPGWRNDVEVVGWWILAAVLLAWLVWGRRGRSAVSKGVRVSAWSRAVEGLACVLRWVVLPLWILDLVLRRTRLTSGNDAADLWSVLALPMATVGVGCVVWELWKRRDEVGSRAGWTQGLPGQAGRSPRHFAWLAAALLSPVAILGLMGGLAVAREWTSSRDAAIRRAQEVAQAARSKIDELFRVPTEAGMSGAAEVLVVDAGNRLLEPGTCPWPPLPAPLNDLEIPEKRRAWEEARAAFDSGQWDEAAEGYEEVLGKQYHLGRIPQATDAEADTVPPRNRAIALFRRALALEHLADDTLGAADAFHLVLQQAAVVGNSSLLTEAGIPVSQLAALKILDLAGDEPDSLPLAWRSDIRELTDLLGRSAWTPFLDTVFKRLRPMAEELVPGVDAQLAVDLMTREYDRVRRLRDIHEVALGARGQGEPWPGAFWIGGDPEGWLAVQLPATNTVDATPGVPQERRFRLIGRQVLQDVLRGAMGGGLPGAPLAMRFSVVGGAVTCSEGAGVDVANAGGLAADRWSLPNGEPAELSVALADPAAFFRVQRRRVQWLAWLLVGTLGAALVAVGTTHRALVRQHELAVRQSNFVSAVSHELRAPLGSIRLLAEGLERGAVAGESQRLEYFRLIGQETRRLGSLVENILDLSRIQQGRKRYEMEATDLAALVEATVSAFVPLAQESAVRIDWERPPPGITAEAVVDGRSIQQALLNLLDNALKHSPSGCVIRVGMAEGTSGGVPVWRLSVADEGPGLPVEERERVFEPFYRAGPELTRGTKGIGIGLTIVRHIVTAHGGTIEIESAANRGTTFCLVLPVEQPPVAPSDHPRSKRSGA